MLFLGEFMFEVEDQSPRRREAELYGKVRWHRPLVWLSEQQQTVASAAAAWPRFFGQADDRAAPVNGMNLNSITREPAVLRQGAASAAAAGPAPVTADGATL